MTNTERIRANNAELREAIEMAEKLPDAGGGGTPTPTQEKAVDITENGTHTVTPDDGYALSMVTANVNVQPKLQEKSVTPTTQEQEVTPDAPYDGMSKVNVGAVKTAEQATPSITVGANGLITAKVNQSEGYVSGGEKSATEQLPTTAGNTVTPSNAEQTVVSEGTFVTGDIKVAKIPSDYIKPTGTKSITENGTHDVTSFAAVNVDVPSEDLTAVLNAQEQLINELEAELEGKAAGGGVSIETCTVKINNQCVSRGTHIIKLVYLTLANGELVQEYGDNLSLSESEIEIENIVCGTYMYVEINRSYSFTYIAAANSGKYLRDGVFLTEFYTPYEANSVCTVTVFDDD